MSSENIIDWNAANWITVVLMVALGFAVLGAVAKLWQSRQTA
jgi:hypothetical protein